MPDLDRSPRREWIPWAALAILLVAMVALRLRLADMPLERDEGEYAYAGQLLLQGVPPYRLAYNMKFPGTYGAYAAILAVFGQTTVAVHVGTTLVVAINVMLVFLLARRWPGCGNGVVAATTMALLSSDPGAFALAGHATHFVVLPTLAAFLLLSTGWGRSFVGTAAAGALLGVAVLMKQPGAMFWPLAAVIVWRDRWNRVVALAMGSAAPLLITAGLLVWAGVFGRCWFWTVQYGRFYAGQVPGPMVLEMLSIGLHQAMRFSWPLWCIAALGLGVGWQKRDRQGLLLRAGLLASGFVAASVGFYYREHYFILLMPAAALLAGAAIRAAGRWMPIALFSLACVMFVVLGRSVLLAPDAHGASRLVFGRNPFVQTELVGQYLRAHAPVGRPIAVIGSEPQVYFTAQRRSATGYIYTYGLMEDHPFSHQMQREMATEIESAHPSYVVVVHDQLSWLPRPTSDRWIFNWSATFTANDVLVGIIPSDPRNHAYWDADCHAPDATALASTASVILVYRHANPPMLPTP